MALSVRVLSLCSGVGWLDLAIGAAIEHLGGRSRVVGYVERDAYAASVLLARMEDQALEPAPIWCGCLEDLDCTELAGRVDLVTAGFPCQPWSGAGKRAGLDDERWLWPAIVRIIGDVGPRYVFLENVPGLVTGGGLEHVLSDLAEMGFDAEWAHLKAGAVGASHRRERVFILADANGGRRGEAVGDAIGPRLEKRRRERGDGQKKCEAAERASDSMASISSGAQFTSADLFAPGPNADWAGVDEHLWPAVESGVCVLVDGRPVVVDASRVDQLRCAGNGVVPLQAAAAFVELLRRLNC